MAAATLILIGKVFIRYLFATLESKLREFQFKILNRIVFTNEKLFRFGMADSPSCAFCQTEVESVEHLLFPVEYHLIFGNISCPGCTIITFLLIT